MSLNIQLLQLSVKFTCPFSPNICPVNIETGTFLIILFSRIHDCFDILLFLFLSFLFYFSLWLSYVFADGELKFNYFVVKVKSCFQDKKYFLNYQV